MIVHVYGVPAPQGSKRHVGGGLMVEMSKRVKPWREAVKHAALDAGGKRLTGAVAVHVTFYFPRPKSHYRTGRHVGLLRPSAPGRPATRPDVDKLVRSTLDALKDAGVYGDDGQVSELVAVKRYRDAPGATIQVQALDYVKADR